MVIRPFQMQNSSYQIAFKTCELATKFVVLSRQKRLDFFYFRALLKRFVFETCPWYVRIGRDKQLKLVSTISGTHPLLAVVFL